jgi:hypothetical protein
MKTVEQLEAELVELRAKVRRLEGDPEVEANRSDEFTCARDGRSAAVTVSRLALRAGQSYDGGCGAVAKKSKL